jgi:hypothetical protein
VQRQQSVPDHFSLRNMQPLRSTSNSRRTRTLEGPQKAAGAFSSRKAISRRDLVRTMVANVLQALRRDSTADTVTRSLPRELPPCGGSTRLSVTLLEAAASMGIHRIVIVAVGLLGARDEQYRK